MITGVVRVIKGNLNDNPTKERGHLISFADHFHSEVVEKSLIVSLFPKSPIASRRRPPACNKTIIKEGLQTDVE